MSSSNFLAAVALVVLEIPIAWYLTSGVDVGWWVVLFFVAVLVVVDKTLPRNVGRQAN